MDFNDENLVKYRKIKIFLYLGVLLILVVMVDFLLKTTIFIPAFYKFKHFSMKPYDLVDISSSKNSFIGRKILKIDSIKGYYKILNNHLVSFSDYFYVISKFKDDYSVFLKKTNKFLFSFRFKGYVFAKGNAIFALNELYKSLVVYGIDGSKILSLKFIASILSFDYNNDILSVGLSDGKVYVYKQGNLAYIRDAPDIGVPVLYVKLSLDNKYLCVVRKSDKCSLELINLDDQCKQVLSINNLKIKNFNSFLKIDDFYNLLIETNNSFLMINIENGKILKVNNRNSVLSASYNSFYGIYRIYFYDLETKVINLRTYSANSFKLLDNIFFKDRITSYIELDDGILYFNDDGDLRYLGM
ncbi:hypothetical protein F0310_01520 [Borrelia sp. A-FGy1]|uniref:hypothetical protein n=1 Tax=Borrelia sp. A-FGy1 TaxID=2608247 RepID=UPI0015F6E6D7|nr:hypothetical protein [Borrelia sp. A-FGy1]QMU99104.1 hypothetical protein F0310_01520 [Borrelia sp. A-FGy1]